MERAECKCVCVHVCAVGLVNLCILTVGQLRQGERERESERERDGKKERERERETVVI